MTGRPERAANPTVVKDVPCPTCGAQGGSACRSRTTRRSTDTHVARTDAFVARRNLAGVLARVQRGSST